MFGLGLISASITNSSGGGRSGGLGPGRSFVASSDTRGLVMNVEQGLGGRRVEILDLLSHG